MTAQDFVQADMQQYNTYAWGSFWVGERGSEATTAYVQVCEMTAGPSHGTCVVLNKCGVSRGFVEPRYQYHHSHPIERLEAQACQVAQSAV